MVEKYPVDIQVLELEERCRTYLEQHGFRRARLSDVHPTDVLYLEGRDRREISFAVELTPKEQWRNKEDYLVFESHDCGTLAYVRPNPLAPFIYHSLPFEIHLRTAAPQGFLAEQYFSLPLPQRIMGLLLKNFQSRGDNSISAIADMDKSNVLRRIPHQADEIEGDALPVHIFHSVYVSREREEKGGYSDREKAVEDLSEAIGSVIVSSHLFSRKQIAYYEAGGRIDRLFGDTALIA